MTDRELDDCRRLGISPLSLEKCRVCGTAEPTCYLEGDVGPPCTLLTDRWDALEIERARETLRKYGATL